MSDDQVFTPAGPRPQSQVREIAAGHYIDGSTGNLVEHDASGKIVKDHGPIAEGRVNTNAIRDSAVVKAPGPALQNGLITFAEWTNNTSTPVNMLMVTWTVPPPPTTDSGQTIYLYIGIEATGAAIELALQWGPSAAGGGNSWNLATWYITPSVTLHTTVTPVSTGQKLIGAIALSIQSGSLFSYEAQFVGLPNTLLTLNNIPQLTSLYVAFATFNATGLSNYPNATDTIFTNVVVQAGYSPPKPVWQPINVVTSLGQHTSVLSNAYGDGYIVIYYV
jgi:hypothetical protein